MFLYTALQRTGHCQIRQDVEAMRGHGGALHGTALAHGVAGFTAKSGRQAAVETVADPERERSLGKRSRPHKRAKHLGPFSPSAREHPREYCHF